jgi:hypothetical protein
MRAGFSQQAESTASSTHPNQVNPISEGANHFLFWSDQLHIKHDRPPKKRREVK